MKVCSLFSMIISMFDVVCVTNRKLCAEDLCSRIEKIAKCQPKAIILREKDLSEKDYKALAAEVMKICGLYGTPCILHTFIDTAIELNADKIHLPLAVFREKNGIVRENFRIKGVSCHSVQEAEEASRLGADYITAGHIYETDCKKGLAGRGTAFLESVCRAVNIPVYAIGGISPKNIAKIRDAGAEGACIMSSLMKCTDVNEYMKNLRKDF